MKKILAAFAFLAMLTATAQCDLDTAAKIAKGTWNCDFETDMGIVPLVLLVTETRGDSAKGTFSYTTQYTGMVTGKIKGKITLTEETGNRQQNACPFRISGSWSEVTAGGFAGFGNFVFDFSAGTSFNGHWTERGGTGRWKWKGKKNSAE